MQLSPPRSTARNLRRRRVSDVHVTRCATLRVIVIAAIVGGSTNVATQARQARTFDVISVKKSAPDSRTRVDLIPGRFSAIRVTLRDLVKLAYPIGNRIRNDDQIVGGADWIGSLHFDVVATGAPGTLVAQGGVAPAEGAALDDLRAMLQSLLASRFALVLHHESRDTSIYALRRVRADHLGARLRRATTDCAQESRASTPDVAACGGFRLLGPGRMTAHAVTIPMFVSVLSNLPVVGRAVEDRTELPGRYDLDLTWATDAQPDGPSMFTAVQEQLGVKLETTRAAVDVIVIDKAERPSPD